MEINEEIFQWFILDVGPINLSSIDKSRHDASFDYVLAVGLTNSNLVLNH